MHHGVFAAFVFVTFDLFAFSQLRLRDIDGDPHRRNLAGVLAPMRRRSTFGKPFARADDDVRFAFLVIRHLALQHIGDGRAIDMVVECLRAARLHGDAAHSQRAALAGFDLIREIEGPERWIDRTAKTLGIDRSDYLTDTYAGLFFAWKRKVRSTASEMTFRAVGRGKS